MASNKAKSVTFEASPSSDPQCGLDSATNNFGSGHMAYSGSYGEISQTAYRQLNLNPLAFSTPADIQTRSLSGGPLSNSSVQSDDSFLSQEPLDYTSGPYMPDAVTQTSPSLMQDAQGFYSSLLLPGSINVQSSADFRYQPTSEKDHKLQLQQDTINNSTSCQSKVTQDSEIHSLSNLESANMTQCKNTQVLPVVTEQLQVTNPIGYTSYSDQSTQLIQEQLQHQLSQVQQQLHQLLLLQQQLQQSVDSTITSNINSFTHTVSPAEQQWQEKHLKQEEGANTTLCYFTVKLLLSNTIHHN